MNRNAILSFFKVFEKFVFKIHLKASLIFYIQDTFAYVSNAVQNEYTLL